MPLFFSEKPGCFESHLQRRYRNPLLGGFGPVTQEMVNEARKQDEAETKQFQEDFTALMNRAIELQTNTDSEIILKLKEDIDKLYEHGAGLGGDLEKYRQGLQKLIKVVMQAVWKGAGNDMTARNELEQEEIARQAHYELLQTPLIAHLLRPDSPVTPEQLAPTLLGEDETIVTQVLSMFDPEHISELLQQAEQALAPYQGGHVQLKNSNVILALIRQHASSHNRQ